MENIALRHQLAVYKRSVEHQDITDGDRAFWFAVLPELRRVTVGRVAEAS